MTDEGPEIVTPRARILALTGCAALVLAVIVARAQDVYSSDEGQMTEFDRSIWADEEIAYAAPYPRFEMAGALIRSHLEPGMTRDEVLALLGPATDTPYFADRGLVYWLSQSREGLGVDSHWLVIDFDEDGRLTIAEMVRD